MESLATGDSESIAQTQETAPVTLTTPLLLSTSSLVGGLVQGVCAVLVASSTLRVFAGIGSLAAAVKSSSIHSDAVRIPLMLISTALAILTLFVLWNARRLRNLTSARWRKRPLTSRQKMTIAISLVSSILSLVLAAGEAIVHPLFHG